MSICELLANVSELPPAAITAIAGFIGVVVGAVLTAWLAGRRERKQRRLAFIQKQLSEFYSPMLGLRAEIKALSELRKKLQDAAEATWEGLFADLSPAEIRSSEEKEWPRYESLIKDGETQLRGKLIPAYEKMLEIFRDTLWLAEQETLTYYPELVEFLDVWRRWLDGSLPPHVVKNIGHSEAKLHPFYAHIEAKHSRLRKLISRG